MLFDPFEEQLDLPSTAIEIGDGDRREREIVGQEHEPFAGVGIFEFDAAQRRVEVLARVEAREHDSLSANQACAAVERMRIAAVRRLWSAVTGSWAYSVRHGVSKKTLHRWPMRVRR